MNTVGWIRGPIPLLIILFLSGCGAPVNKAQETSPPCKPVEIRMDLAQKAQDQARTVPGVKDSVAVVIDKDVAVAVRIKGWDRLRVKGIKEQVNRGVTPLFQTDPCYKVYVTSDKKLYAKLEKLAQRGESAPSEERSQSRRQLDKILKDILG